APGGTRGGREGDPASLHREACCCTDRHLKAPPIRRLRERSSTRGRGMSIATGVMTGERVVSAAEERRVIVASSVGTVFEWYDFYLYAILAPFFAGLFFPPGNQTAALLGAFGAYAAGFLIRPFVA